MSKVLYTILSILFLLVLSNRIKTCTYIESETKITKNSTVENKKNVEKSNESCKDKHCACTFSIPFFGFIAMEDLRSYIFIKKFYDKPVFITYTQAINRGFISYWKPPDRCMI